MECDEEQIEYLSLDIYNRLGLPKPRIIWTPNPWVLADVINQVTKPTERITMRKIAYHWFDGEGINLRSSTQSFMDTINQSVIIGKRKGLVAEEILGKKIIRHSGNPLSIHRQLRLKAWEKWVMSTSEDELVNQITIIVKDNPYIAFTDEMILISEKHTSLHLTESEELGKNILHRLRGPAISFPNVDIYALLGIQFKKKYVFPETLSILDVMRVRNVNVRAFLIGQIGKEKVLEDERINTREENDIYKLIDISKVLGRGYSPCLVMKNPSTNEMHVEGVSDLCNTIQEAINWRAYGDIRSEWRPIQLT